MGITTWPLEMTADGIGAASCGAGVPSRGVGEGLLAAGVVEGRSAGVSGGGPRLVQRTSAGGGGCVCARRGGDSLRVCVSESVCRRRRRRILYICPNARDARPGRNTTAHTRMPAKITRSKRENSLLISSRSYTTATHEHRVTLLRIERPPPLHRCAAARVERADIRKHLLLRRLSACIRLVGSTSRRDVIRVRTSLPILFLRLLARAYPLEELHPRTRR